MSCFFCSSNGHVSHYCDIHETDDARREIIASKKCCKSCLTPHDFQRISYRYSYYGISCRHCKRYRKCYICFSKAHHTVFCPDRLTASNIFLPNIDRDLLPRFMKILSREDDYSLFLSSSIDPEFVKLKPFKVKSVNFLFNCRNISFSNLDILIAKKIYLGFEGQHELYSKNIVFRTQYLDAETSRLSSNEFLQILSLSKAKALTCRYAVFRSTLTIMDIFKNGPYLKDVQMQQSNVEISNSWPDDLLQFNLAQLKLSLSLPDLNFNIERLAALMKKNSATIRIFVPTIIPIKRIHQLTSFEKETNELSKYFTPNLSKFQSSTGLFVHIHDEFGSVVSKQYVLKDD